MNELLSAHSTGPDRRRKRMRWLIGVFVAMFSAHIVISYVRSLDSSSMPGFLSVLLNRATPLDSWITEAVVRDFLDGRSAYRVTVDSNGKVTSETLIIRKAGISSLRIGPGEGVDVSVRFDLEQEGQRYVVEGTCATAQSKGEGWHDPHLYRFTGYFDPIR